MQLLNQQLPMRDVRRTDVPNPDPVPEGLDSYVDGWVGRWKSRAIYSKQLWEAAGRCEQIYLDNFVEIDQKRLRTELAQNQSKLRRLGNRWASGFFEVLPSIVAATQQTLRLQPYRTQMMGAFALANGTLAEMATGEGKTLTIALAAVAAGWSGRPVHIITANDYLAQRDAKHLNQLYEFCGLHAASVTAELSAEERQKAYRAPIVYCTGKELVADFLRDRIVLGDFSYAPLRSVSAMGQRRFSNQTVLQGIHIGFVDEADNQLIDEAVTPLIISRREENSNIAEATNAAHQLAASLLPGEDYEINDRHKEIQLTRLGRSKVEAWTERQEGLLSAPSWMSDLTVTALQARHFFLEGKQYVISEGKLIIVDEFTGRQMPGRSWRLGLHQAVEAKESLEISTPSETLARLSFQRFYRLFRHLAGITGTAQEASLEFWKIYRLPLIVVPRHRPNIREDASVNCYFSEREKYEAVVKETKQCIEKGRPVLVGTRSVSSSERLAQMLRHEGIHCLVLNAARHADEAQIISLAGQEGRVTIATNMAGRGTDILLGKGVRKKGGLHVILSEPHESRRVDRQLMGRSGRQGDPGSTARFASTEDEIFRRYLPDWMVNIVSRPAFFRIGLTLGINRLLLTYAQVKAEKVSRIRRIHVLSQDLEMGKQLMNRMLDKI